MIATLSKKGQTVIPEVIREAAGLRAGDKLDVGYTGGMIFLRKRVPLTPGKIRMLMRSGKSLPDLSPRKEAEVLDVVRRVRAWRRSGFSPERK